jgi:transglutaminase-like putative cysteine protease
MVFPFARHVSERGHGHPDGFRFKVKLKTERVAIAFRFVLAYAFVRPESEQNSSHLQIDCDRVAGNFFPTTPMDFAAWIEVYLGGRWHAFDPGAPGLSLQIEELQGDFDRMQGGPNLGPAKSDQISIVWTASPYSRSREDIIFSREEPSRYWSAP